MAAARLSLLVPALVLESALIGLAVLGPLRDRVVETIAVLIGTSAVYLISTALILKGSQCDGSRRRMQLAGILAFALLFRLTAWTIEPAFSDDLNRYRWEARVAIAGGSPYEATPDGPAWAALRDETHSRIPGLEFRAVYGPFTETVYRWAYQGITASGITKPGQQVFWLKAVSALFELGVLAGLYQLLLAARVPAARILIYAWCPLPVFEFWANGHNDTLLLCPLVWALWAGVKERWTLAFALLGVAIAAKVWPLALVPLFLGWGPRGPLRSRQSLIMLPVVGLFLAPYGTGLIRNIPFLSGFLGGWRNNDSLYGVLLWLWGGQYAAKYSAFAIVAAAAAWVTVRKWSLTRGSLAVIVTMLLVSANCHPWYLSWMLVLLPLHPSLWLLLWEALVPLAYQVLPAWEILGEWDGSAPLRWLVYGPVFAVLAWEAAARRRAAKKLAPRDGIGEAFFAFFV